MGWNYKYQGFGQPTAWIHTTKGPCFQLTAAFLQPLTISQWSGAPASWWAMSPCIIIPPQEKPSAADSLRQRWVPPPPSPSCGGRSVRNKSLTPARLPRRFKPPLSIVHLLEVRHKARKRSSLLRISRHTTGHVEIQSLLTNKSI